MLQGVRFTLFPPVLNIHLKRFEYDMASGNMVKVCPLQLFCSVEFKPALQTSRCISVDIHSEPPPLTMSRLSSSALRM